MPNKRGGSKPDRKESPNKPKERAMDKIFKGFIVPMGPGNKSRGNKRKSK